MTNLEVRRIRSKGPCRRQAYETFNKIVELQREAFAFSDELLVPAYGLDMTNCTFALYKGGEIVGYAMCCLSDDEEGDGLELTLQQLGIAKAERRHGYGTFLMEGIIAEARKPRLPIHSIKWSQDLMLARVVSFYICDQVPGVGMTVTKNRYGVLDGNYAGLPSHRMEMRLDLSPALRQLPKFGNFQLVDVFESGSMAFDRAPRPRWQDLNSNGAAVYRVPIPWDFEAMKKRPEVAAAWQDGVVSVMSTLCGNGYRAVNFRQSNDPDWGEYMLMKM